MIKKGLAKNAYRIDFRKFFIVSIVTLLFLGSAASAADTGWLAPSSNVGGSGVTSPTNAYSSNSVYARFAANGNYWNWYGYPTFRTFPFPHN